MPLAPGSKKHGIDLLTAGPRGRFLLTFSGVGKPNRTNVAGSLLALAGRATLLDKALFGVAQQTVLTELFTCGSRIVARVDFGNTSAVSTSPASRRSRVAWASQVESSAACAGSRARP